MNKPVNKYTSMAQQINEHFGCKGSEDDVNLLAQQIKKLCRQAQQAVEIFGDKVSKNAGDEMFQRILNDAFEASIEKKLTKSEIGAINFAVDGTDENGQNVLQKEDHDRLGNTVVVVRDREHLDVLIEYVLKRAQMAVCWIPLFLVSEIRGNVIDLDETIDIDLNFLDVSKVTDMSGLFKDFDVSPRPETGWFCKIRLNISKWNVSNVTKMAHMFDCENVDFGDLSKWDRSKVTDC